LIKPVKPWPLFPLILVALLLGSCEPTEDPWPTLTPSPAAAERALPTRSRQSAEALPTFTPLPTPTRPLASPTPDPTRPGDAPSEEGTDTHVVQYGETLGLIALQYGTTVEALMEMNELSSSDQVQAGETLIVEVGSLPIGPADKLIPDSELVYGPAFSHFNVPSFAGQWGGYLVEYTEEVEGVELSGPEIVQLVAQQYSVGPRLLLALLELQAGWVTESEPRADTLFYPMGQAEEGWEGLFIQLSWTANRLNLGYYGWQAGWLRNAELADGTLIRLAPGLNAGTVAVQRYLAIQSSPAAWEIKVTWDGSLMDIYQTFFGDPFRYAIEPLVPADLTQPEMALPWKQGEMWYVTSGPHGGWGSYSGWAALDFAPGSSEELGCRPASEWVRAVCPGRVVRSENGEVMVDLDDDGFEGTGWTVLYMHIASEERVPVGTWLETGDKIGHPSCEGGVSDGTHLHIARRYNGRWIEAEGPVPFVMDGWTPISYGVEYDGALIKGEETREAWGHGHDPEFNGIVAGP
jgi:LasA protease